MVQLVTNRLTIAIVVCSLAVLAFCVLVAAWAIAAISAPDDPFSVMGGIIVLPLATTLGIAQYLATFRQNLKAARMSAVLTFIVAGLTAVPCIATIGAGLFHGADFRGMWSFLLTLLSISLGGSIVGWLNVQWSRRLKPIAGYRETVASPNTFTLRELLLAVAAVASISCLVNLFSVSTPPRFAEHVSREQVPYTLPPAARDVSYCQSYRGTIALEFTIDEGSFIAWVDSGIGSIESQSAGVPLLPITARFSMTRYPAIRSGLQGPHTATITNGLYYKWSKEDRGVVAVFDRATNRAYYFAHYH